MTQKIGLLTDQAELELDTRSCRMNENNDQKKTNQSIQTSHNLNHIISLNIINTLILWSNLYQKKLIVCVFCHKFFLSCSLIWLFTESQGKCVFLIWHVFYGKVEKTSVGHYLRIELQILQFVFWIVILTTKVKMYFWSYFVTLKVFIFKFHL